MSESRTPTVDLALPARVVRTAGKRSNLPVWFFVWMAYITIRQEFMVATDEADLEQMSEWVSQLPTLLAWIGNNGATIAGAVAVLGSAWVTFKRSAHSASDHPARRDTD